MNKNPFIYTTENGREYLTANCSLNKVIFAKLPVYGIEDSLEGMSVKDIFGAGIIIDEIKNSAGFLGINIYDYKEMDLPKILDTKIDEGNQEALRIARKYGNRLGMLLLVLKTGLHENRIVRVDWDDSHWEHWANIETVYLAGGLASGRLGEYMIEIVNELFETANVTPYNIVRNTNGSEIGTKGCLKQLKDNNDVHILFDLGQTKIKRMIAVKQYDENGNSNDDSFNLIKIPSRKSINMSWENDDETEKIKQAQELHEYLVDSILDTYNEALNYGNVGWEIVISIASYVIDGKLNDVRSGYAKLCALSENYAGYLASELEKRLNRAIMVQLIHDGTAAGLYYAGAQNSVCITAGTAFGVGFPEIKLEMN